MICFPYRFDGPPAELLPAYQRLLDAYSPESLDLHVCVAGQSGLTVLDACPSRAAFDGFSRSDEFQAAIARAGLPTPRIEPLGDVYSAHIREEVRR